MFYLFIFLGGGWGLNMACTRRGERLWNKEEFKIAYYNNIVHWPNVFVWSRK